MHTNHFVAMSVRSIDFDVPISLRNKRFLNYKDKVFLTNPYYPSRQFKTTSGGQSCD